MVIGFERCALPSSFPPPPVLARPDIPPRRDPARLRPLQPGTPVHGMDSLLAHRAGIDVLVLCGGSKDDLPQQSPALAAHFSLVDSFDTHARIPEHFDRVDAAARAAGTTALISAGWDPGMFSLQRLMGEALLPDGATYTFWGKGSRASPMRRCRSEEHTSELQSQSNLVCRLLLEKKKKKMKKREARSETYNN